MPIPHSLHINLASTLDSALSDPWEFARGTVPGLRNELEEYRENNREHVRGWWFTSPGLSSDTRAIAVTIGSCIVGSPELP
ncbi:MAG: hypothetical protein M3O31_04580 [Acidobacteriota bacterium]|nr:hypothetical protein [Acidobacteriota bacterium]